MVDIGIVVVIVVVVAVAAVVMNTLILNSRLQAAKRLAESRSLNR